MDYSLDGLRALREARGVSQERVAKAIRRSTGDRQWTQQRVSCIETGQMAPTSYRDMVSWCAALELGPAETHSVLVSCDFFPDEYQALITERIELAIGGYERTIKALEEALEVSKARCEVLAQENLRLRTKYRKLPTDRWRGHE